jgi:hypothetical protein
LRKAQAGPGILSGFAQQLERREETLARIVDESIGSAVERIACVHNGIAQQRHLWREELGRRFPCTAIAICSRDAAAAL